MKTLAAEALPSLPLEIKSLISDGVYSLFSVRNVNDADNYVLIISDGGIYILDNSGDVVRVLSKSDLKSLDIVEAITFVGVNNNKIRINAA